MRRLSVAALVVASTITFSQMASAAPPPPPWTGFYIGGNIGYSWGNADTDITGSGTIKSFAFKNNFGFADSNTARLDGVIGGFQIGYNYQLNPNWVLGLVADIQASGERGSNSFADTFSSSVCVTFQVQCLLTAPLNGNVAMNYEAKILWFGTARARVGYLIAPELLVYATGGLAYGRVDVSGNVQVTATTPAAAASLSAFNTFGDSRVNFGFSVGGGIESSAWLPPNWTWGLEYLYLDLGSIDTTTSLSASGAIPLPTSMNMTITTHTHFTDNIVRLVLNYRFP